MNKVKIGILASGRGSNAQAIIDAIAAGAINGEVVIIISDNPAAEVLKRAEANRIPACCIKRSAFSDKHRFEEALAAELERYGVQLVVLAGFMRLLSVHFISRFPRKIMNIHPSLLPSFPGLDAQGQAIRYGAKVSGCTVHFVDEGMDTGPVILQQAVPVYSEDTADQLAERILQVEHSLYPRAVDLFCRGRLHCDGRIVRIDAAKEEES